MDISNKPAKWVIMHPSVAWFWKCLSYLLHNLIAFCLLFFFNFNWCIKLCNLCVILVFFFFSSSQIRFEVCPGLQLIICLVGKGTATKRINEGHIMTLCFLAGYRGGEWPHRTGVLAKTPLNQDYRLVGSIPAEVKESKGQQPERMTSLLHHDRMMVVSKPHSQYGR